MAAPTIVSVMYGKLRSPSAGKNVMLYQAFTASVPLVPRLSQLDSSPLSAIRTTCSRSQWSLVSWDSDCCSYYLSTLASDCFLRIHASPARLTLSPGTMAAADVAPHFGAELKVCHTPADVHGTLLIDIILLGCI